VKSNCRFGIGLANLTANFPQICLMPSLRIVQPAALEGTYFLKGDRVTVGRRPDNAIQVKEGSISAYHAEFLLVDGHYRLHDLASTNLSFVDGNPVTDFHLWSACKVGFGNVICEFDPVAKDPVPHLTASQMEKDMAFMRAENQELQNKVDGLQRQVDILSSARLVTGKGDGSSSAEAKRLALERDELRFQNAGLKLELEKMREEMVAVTRHYEQARLEQVRLDQIRAAKAEDLAKTQRIIAPA
jgi:hypothetical protein